MTSSSASLPKIDGPGWEDGHLPHAPAADRNQAALTDVLRRLLPDRGRVLEVASGTGQHVAHWAAHFAGVDWQPSDVDARALASIEAWRRQRGHPNLAPPLELDVGQTGWPARAPGPWDAIVVVNLLHITAWTTAEHLLTGASDNLAAEGKLIVYGPFAEDGVLQPESNVAFDAWLKRENAAWGVRDLSVLRRVGERSGLILAEPIAMPANNRVLVFTRRHQPPTEPATCG